MSGTEQAPTINKPKDNPCTTWDFTIYKIFHGEELDHNTLCTFLRMHCKKWCFQLENGLNHEANGPHYQGRISLKVKTRQNGVDKIFRPHFPTAHLSRTSNENTKNNFYVMKLETKLDGPWMDVETQRLQILENMEGYIPRQIRNVTTLYHFQEHIINDCKNNIDEDTVNVLIDFNGMIGKTWLAQYLSVHKLALSVPPLKDFKDISQFCGSFTPQKAYIIDMPRALSKDNLKQFYSGIEYLKGGVLFDTRYKGQRVDFDRPIIWIFTNEVPDTSNLSLKRWKLWIVNNNRELVPYGTNTIQRIPTTPRSPIIRPTSPIRILNKNNV